MHRILGAIPGSHARLNDATDLPQLKADGSPGLILGRALYMVKLRLRRTGVLARSPLESQMRLGIFDQF